MVLLSRNEVYIMKRIAVVTDSTTLDSPKLLNHPDLYVAPLEVIANGKTYEDRVELQEEDWINFLKADATMTTSQPSLKNTIDVLKKARDGGYDHIFVLPLTSNLSGTYNGFVLANNELEIENLEIIDTKAIAGQITVMIEKVFEYAKQGRSVEDIRSMIYTLMDNNITYIYPATLKRLVASGRMNKAVGSLASLLKLRLLLVLENKGEQIEKHEIYRTEKKLYADLVQQFKNMNVNEDDWVIYVLHVENKEGADHLSTILKEHFGNIEIRFEMLPGVIATHVGLGVLGVQAVSKESR